MLVKGKSLDGNPISKMTRKQIMATIIAHKIESDQEKKAQKQANRRRR